FPQQIREQFHEPLYHHRLRREIVATQIANDIVNTMGISFAQRVMESTGASAGELATAYVTARDIFQLESYWYEIEQLDYQIPASLQIELMSKMMRRVRRATRWLLRNRRADFQPGKELETFAHGMKILNENLSELLRSEQLQNWQDRCVELQEQGLPEMLAVRSATPGYLHSGLSVVDTAVESKKEVLTIAKVYFLLADHLDLPWFAEQISD